MKRDLMVLEYLYLNKMATSQQIMRDLFPGLHKTIFFRRMRVLLDFSYVEKVIYEKKYIPDSIYYLSKKGFKEFFPDSLEYGNRVQLKSNSLAHDHDLLDIQYHLKKAKRLLDYFPENYIQSNFCWEDNIDYSQYAQVHCDAAVKIQFPKGQYLLALEYEASRKKLSRDTNLFVSYYSRPDIPAVLFICKDNKILEAVMKTDKEFSERYSSKIYFSTLNNVLSPEGKMEFKNSTQGKISLEKMTSSCLLKVPLP